VGGKGSRLGGARKADLPFAGAALLDVVRAQLAATGIFDEIFTVGSGGDVEDAQGFVGPAAGVVAACGYASSGWLFVCACDMPFVSPALVKGLLEAVGEEKGVLPHWRAGYEPLFVWLKAELEEPLKKALRQNAMRLAPAMLACGFAVAEEPILRRYDPQLLSFFNINTESDLEEAQRIAQEKGVKTLALP